MYKAVFALAASLWFAGYARAEDGRQIVGSWVVTDSDDRFGKGGTFTAAAFDEGMSTALVIRCIEKDLSIAILDAANDPRPLDVGTTFVVKLRTDKEPVMTSIGKAISERLIQVETQADMVRTIRKGRETALRLENEHGVSRTVIVKTKNNGKAFARIAKECALD
jgi:hypothetical protein